MITRMTKYNFVLLNSDKEQFLKDLQELGVVDITRSTKPTDEHSLSLMSKIEDIKEQISNINNCSNSITVSLRNKISELEQSYAELKVWGEYDIEKLSAFGLHYYCVSKKLFNDLW